jgi:hypothetical protein
MCVLLSPTNEQHPAGSPGDQFHSNAGKQRDKTMPMNEILLIFSAGVVAGIILGILMVRD